MLASAHATISTSTLRPATGTLRREQDILRRQIMDGLDHIDRLMARIRSTTNGAQAAEELPERQPVSPLAAMNESINEITKSVTNNLDVMRRQMNRLMSTSPICHNPLR